MLSKKYNVLIVDDEPKILQLLKRVLESKSITIFTANCGEDALVLMAESPEMAVIVSNYHMGSMSGGDFLNRVKIQSPNSIRILMTAGLGEDKLYEMKDGELIDSFAIKPILIDNFISQINVGIEQYLKQK